MYIGGVGTTGKFPVALYTTHASEYTFFHCLS